MADSVIDQRVKESVTDENTKTVESVASFYVAHDWLAEMDK